MEALSVLKSFLFLMLLNACSVADTSPPDERAVVDREELLGHVEYLASDELEGRLPGSEGSRKARAYICRNFESYGLSPFNGSWKQPFNHGHPRGEGDVKHAANIVGYVEGREHPDRYIVITAHYDHLGISDGEIFNGSDDNASGTGGLLAAARWFGEHPPENSILFVALDAEEMGLRGAYYFVDNPVVPLEQMVMNVNMDMISISVDNEIYASGTRHYEFLRPVIETSVQRAPVTVHFGHDNPDGSEQDWTTMSDHYAFHRKSIPYVYFGVEDHDYYHTPEDTFERIHPDFYVDAVSTIIQVIRDLDAELDEIQKASGRVGAEADF